MSWDWPGLIRPAATRGPWAVSPLLSAALAICPSCGFLGDLLLGRQPRLATGLSAEVLSGWKHVHEVHVAFREIPDVSSQKTRVKAMRGPRCRQ